MTRTDSATPANPRPNDGPDTTAIGEYLAFAHELADAAASCTLPLFRSRMTVDDKSAGREVAQPALRYDPVTEADRRAEAAMRERIAARYPAHGILGEEHGRVAGQAPWTWVLDPVDGTRAFISGLPLWGTLIALNDGSRPVLGIMDQPFTGERFYGDGSVAMLRRAGQEQRLSSSACEMLADATVMCTTPQMYAEQADWNAFQRVAQQARLLRYGGDCYAYCMVAAGHVDAVVEAGLQPYDVQALIPIIEGAGGVMTDWDGGDAQQGGRVVASANPRLHQRILATLRAGS
ncbi:histidinol-phosphatase [Paracidovorax citrulli]